jgi:hypothetical protein
MKIETNKQLEALLKILRKQGVYEATIDGITLKLGSLPSKPGKASIEDVLPEAQAKVPAYNGKPFDPKIDPVKTDELTEEQLRDWSVQVEPGTEEAQ